MNLLIPQTLLLSVFGIALYRLWCVAAPPERSLRWVAAIGFLARAIGGQMLFWISWMRLPILRSLQTTDGYWLFARDADFYFPQAIAAAEHGWRAITFYDRSSAASPAYVQLLAGAIWLLGPLVSVGILLNLFCYLGTIALLVRWRRDEPRTRTASTAAIVAISLTPALVLWSLQPLKDSLFQFLFVAFVVAAAGLQRVWLANGSWRTRGVLGALLGVILLLIAGVRWYFAAALIAATAVFLLIIVIRVAQRRTTSLALAAIFIVVLMLIARPHMPRTLMPGSMLATLELARSGFDSGGTTIRSVADADDSSKLSAADEQRVRALLDDQVAAWNRSDFSNAMNAYWKSPQLESVEGTTTIRGWEQVGDAYRRRRGAVADLRMTVLQVTGAGGTATVSGRWDVTTRDGRRQTPWFTTTLRRFPNGEWKIVREVFPSWAQTQTTAIAPLHPERLFIGVAALVVPHTLARRLGFFEIGGGRGLLWFAEIDTLLFDLALLFALRAVLARGTVAWRNPLLWLAVLTTLLVVPPLAYAISNFGTLFRLREMIYLGLFLIAIAANGEGETVSGRGAERADGRSAIWARPRQGRSS